MAQFNEKELKAMLPFLNTPLYAVLERHLKQRIEILKDELVTARDFNTVLELQGRILEVKELLGLREIIEAVKSISE